MFTSIPSSTSSRTRIKSPNSMAGSSGFFEISLENAHLPHSSLCRFQSMRWHSPSQYLSCLHFPQNIKFSPPLRQRLQACCIFSGFTSTNWSVGVSSSSIKFTRYRPLQYTSYEGKCATCASLSLYDALLRFFSRINCRSWKLVDMKQLSMGFGEL